MKRIVRILNNNSGETLIETITATLLISIAFTVLGMMITTAGNLNRSATDVSLAIANEAKTLGDVPKTSITITFTDNIPGSSITSYHDVKVDVQRKGKLSMYSSK